MNRLLLTLVSVYILSISPLFTQEWITLDKDWKFEKNDPAGAASMDFNDTDWKKVSLPHDWAVEEGFDPALPANTGKLPWKGVGWYRKEFSLGSHSMGKQVYLVFDGVMAFPEVYVNGQKVGQWDYGYNSFYVDITGYIDYIGTNLLAVRVDMRQWESRWYPGAGIYRKVRLLLVPKVHFGIWETQILTPVITDDSALVHIYSTVKNTSGEPTNCKLRVTVTNHEGNKVAETVSDLLIDPGTDNTVEQWLTLDKPIRWDVETPYLYSLETKLELPDDVVVTEKHPLGIRSARFAADDGFWLNGRRVQLKGVNLHHDHGPLGAKFYRRAMERQLVMMKDMGANAIRNSHNIAAPELLDLCDSLGLLLFDEAFDKWDRKAGLLPGADFDEFAERNVRNWILRDRNHPCVIIWSVGNEMGDIQFNLHDGFEKLNTMTSLVRKYDPSRPVTMASDNKGSASWRHFDYYDVHSWNYGRRYLPARQLEPGKSVIISESASTLSTRGFYELPLPDVKTDFTKSLQVSSYDLNAPSWAEVADDDFMWQEEDTYVAGEFVWTGFDYLGEPTPYNDEAVRSGFISQQQSARSSYFGIVDLCGIPKDRYYLYKSHWKPDENMVHILPHWNWQGSGYRQIPVFVYTNGNCAELFLNGKSLGMRCKKADSDISIERCRLMWPEVEYEPGELKAIAYKNNKVIGEDVVTTSGDPYRIILKPERIVMDAGGNDLVYILVTAADKDGNLCPLADNLVSFDVKGPAVIEAVGNGNPQSLEPFIAHTRKLFNGKAMLILRSLDEKGTVKVSAKSKGLKADAVSISVK